jgi:hypothetical protein
MGIYIVSVSASDGEAVEDGRGIGVASSHYAIAVVFVAGRDNARPVIKASFAERTAIR